MADLSTQAFPVNTPKFWGNEKATGFADRFQPWFGKASLGVDRVSVRSRRDTYSV